MLMGAQVVGALAQSLGRVVFARRHQLPQILFYSFRAAPPDFCLLAFQQRCCLRCLLPMHDPGGLPQVLGEVVPVHHLHPIGE